MPMRQHIDEMQRHQALRHSHLGEVANAPQMVGVGQRHDATAMRFGPCDAQLHGLLPHHLPVAALAIER
jgi:hypothetical protein